MVLQNTISSKYSIGRKVLGTHNCYEIIKLKWRPLLE